LGLFDAYEYQALYSLGKIHVRGVKLYSSGKTRDNLF